ncbi:cyclin-dependent kinase 5 activator 1-like [Oscarella lobularis]|uniref:cyclin-dependent kinase 5 activator 1-like n=1 Tax=Oscarella lobularis TaxID=121494 RepID=UPI0033135F49
MGATISTQTNTRTRRRLQMSVKKLTKSLQAPVGSIKRWAQGKRKAKEAALKKQSSTNHASPSINDLLRRYAIDVCRRCASTCDGVEPREIERWIRSVDQTLIQLGWQEQEYVTESSLVFLHVLAKESCTPERIANVEELRMTILICLYLGFSYTGNEISYPLKPFLSGATSKKAFWDRCMSISMSMSGAMLDLNRDSTYYNRMRDELCCSSAVWPTSC